jgi:hypothetical protein
MRRKEDKEDAKSRERRGGTTMGEPHAWSRQEERAAAQDAREFGTRGACGGNDYASIRNIVKNIIQCQDFPLTCSNACTLIAYVRLKLALQCLLIKGGTFIWNHSSSFAPLPLALPQDDSVSEPHPSSHDVKIDQDLSQKHIGL